MAGDLTKEDGGDICVHFENIAHNVNTSTPRRVSQNVAHLLRSYSEIRELFNWMIHTFASLRYGQHGCMNVKVRMPQLIDFVREFIWRWAGFTLLLVLASAQK